MMTARRVAINFKIHFRAFAAANPVTLHFLKRIRPVNRVEVLN